MHIFLIASSRHKIKFVLFQDLDHTQFSEYSWSSFCKSLSLSISMRTIYVCAYSSFAYQNRKFAAINFWKTNRHWIKTRLTIECFFGHFMTCGGIQMQNGFYFDR